MKIKKLYTEPATIDPIRFGHGANFIIGESDDSSSKNNGVGKSLCVEFINFALMKRRNTSRVTKIPRHDFDPSTFICIDFDLHDDEVTIKRSLAEAEQPRLIVNGNETIFAKADDALAYLATKMFPRAFGGRIGFREMLGPLIRDERSEFKSIVGFSDTKARIPDNYAPHLMLLGIDPEIYRSIRAILTELDAIAAEEGRIKESVKLVRKKEFKDARLDLNVLDDEVEIIKDSIDALESSPAYDIVKGEIIDIEEEMDDLRRRKAVVTKRLANLAPIAVEAPVDSEEIRDFYNQLREGLGNSVVRELNEVLTFKSKIEQFQRHLLDEKSKVLDVELRSYNKQLNELDRRYAKLLSVLDQEGQLKNLRQTYASYQAKSDELGQLKSFFTRHDQLLIERQKRKSELEAERLALQGSILAASERLRSFERTILDIHQFVQGSRKASFDVLSTSKKHTVDIVMRIDDDGSHSVEREKVFIYDIALLINEYTKSRHPGLLIHDNIFDVDNDTLRRSLEYILTRAPFEEDQQYILTLNIDRIEYCQEEAWFSELQQNVCASFTKSSRFLKTHYQET